MLLIVLIGWRTRMQFSLQVIIISLVHVYEHKCQIIQKTLFCLDYSPNLPLDVPQPVMSE